MTRVLLTFIIITLINNLKSQQFSKIVDYDSTGQGRNMMVFPQKDYIYTLGDYIDSARTDIWPFWAKYDYSGNLLEFINLADNDSLGSFEFSDGSDKYTYINDSLLLIVAGKINNSGTLIDNYIFIIKINKGLIQNSKVLNSDLYGIVSGVGHDKLKNRVVLGTFSYDSSHMIRLIDLDLDLNIKSSTKIRVNDTIAFAPYYIEVNNNKYEIVGQYSKKGLKATTATYFKSIIDTQGIIHSMNIIKPTVPLSGWTLANNRIIQTNNNEYVIASNYYVDNLPNPNNFNLFPHPIRVNNSFDTVRWELKMYDKPNYVNPLNTSFNGLITINNGAEYIGYGDDLFNRSGSCVLYKFTEHGDSLWYKRIIPGDAIKDSLGFVPTYMAAESPRGGLVVVGSVYDYRRPRYNSIRSYIMYLDVDGCLVPDCNKIVTNKDIEDGNEAYFKIYPNPVVDQLKVLCNYSQQGSYYFSLINMQGVDVWSKNVSCNQGDQVFWSVDDIAPGIYVLLISDKDNKVVQEIKLVKL